MKTVLLLLLLLTGQAALYSQSKPPVASAQHRKAKPSSLSDADRLRIRVEFHPHDADAHKQLIHLLRKKYAFRAIAEEDATWVKNNPSDYFALLDLVSYSNAALNDPEFAIAQLRSHLGIASRDDDPEHYDDVTDQLAGELEKRGRTDEALPLFASVVRLNSNEAGFWVDYGEALSLLGRHTEALKALRHGIELSPSMEAFHEALAEALVRSGDLQGAESEYRASLSLYGAQYKAGEPTDQYHSLMSGLVKIEAKNHQEHALAETRLKLAHILLLDKKYDDAVVQTKAALDADQYEFAALYLQAEIFDAKGDHAEGTKTREAAHSAIQKEADTESKAGKKIGEIDPRLLFLNDKLWNERSGDPALPVEILAILEPRISSLSAIERVELAIAYIALGRVMEGRREWEKAFVSDAATDNPVGHHNLGEELLKAGEVRDALPHLQRAYELDPQNLTFKMDYELASQKVKE